MKKQFTIEEIMDRLSRICRRCRCGVMVRPDFDPGPGKWYVSLSGVVVGDILQGGFSSSITDSNDSGSTPEEAIRNVWAGVLKLAQNKNVALMRFNCPDDVNIPGDEPQVWIRWSQELDDWIDVPIDRLPADKLRTYKEQFYRDKL